MSNNFSAILTTADAPAIQSKFNTMLNRVRAKGIPIESHASGVNANFGFFELDYFSTGTARWNEIFTLPPTENGQFYAAMVGEIYNLDRFTAPANSASPVQERSRIFFEQIWQTLNHPNQFANFSQLNGSFNILVFDKREKRLFIVTDRHATISIFVHQEGNYTFLGSESTLVANFLEHSAKLNTEGLVQKLAFGYILGNGTLIKDCQILPPAHVVSLKIGAAMSGSRYWDYAYATQHRKNEEYLDNYMQLFRQSVERRTRGRRTIVPLSGGKDSRTIALAYHLNKNNPAHIQSFTYGEAGANDLIFGSAVAATLGWPYQKYYLGREFPVQYGPLGAFLTGSIFGCFAINGIEFAPMLQKSGEIVLLGTAGDVLSGSFLSEDLFVQHSSSQAQFVHYMLTLFNTVFPVSEISQLVPNLNLQPVNFLSERIKASLDVLPAYPTYADLYDHYNLSQRHWKWLHIGTNFWKSILTVGMPFYDNDLFEFLITVPIEFRRNQKISIETIKKYSPALARIPDCHTGMGLTTSNFKLGIWRFSKQRHVRYALKKLGWDPFRTRGRPVARYSEWIKSQLRTPFSLLLTSDQTHLNGHLNANYIRQILDEHLTGKRSRTSEIDTLVALENFLRLIA